MSSKTTEKRYSEDGFTLIEMIIALVLTTAMIAALTAVFMTSMRTTTATAHRSNQSSDAQVVSAFLIRDGQAAGSMDPQTGSTDPSVGVFTNDPSSCSVTGTVLRFRWINPSGIGSYVDAVYRLSGTNLTRTVCTTPFSGGTATTSTNIRLAKTVSSASARCTTGGTEGACNTGAGGDTAEKIPDSARLTITAANNPSGAVGPYTYSLTANVRPAPFTSGAGGGDPTGVALITLGGVCPGINLDNGALLKIYGDALVNQDGTCVDYDHATLLSHTVTTSSGITDPFGSLQAPSSAGMTARAGCPGGVAQPGFYAAAITLGNGASCTFQSGIYILNHGVTFGNNASVSTAAGGALLYLPNEPLSGGNNASIHLAALQAGEYAGLAVWETVSGSTDLSNNGLLVIAGTLYVPNAVVHFSNNAASPTITAVIALGVDFKNNANASFGPQPKALAVGANVPAVWTAGTPFNPPVQATASGGFGTYTFSRSGLTGLSIDSATGLVSGAPNQTGNRTITITLNDSFGDPPAIANFPITINAGLNITTASLLPDGQQGVAYSTPALTATGGTGARTWSATGLPAGLSIDAATGVIAGTPSATGTSSVPVTVTDSIGATFIKNFSITVRPIITSVVLANKAGGVAGQVEQGDTITVVFSQAMKVSSFCSLWSNDAIDQSLVADGVVTVSMTNQGGAGSNDSMTVTGTGCSGGFKFGTIDLADSGYTTNTATFQKQSAAQINSTIQWTASTHTLVVTLGTKNAGNTGTVVASAPSFAASASIQDTNNVPLGGLPFNLTSGQKF